jgi:hypothetical protein
MFDAVGSPALKTKYLPSGDQLPQHAERKRFQSGRRGLMRPSFSVISHREYFPWIFSSSRLNRALLPSGDQRRNLGSSAAVASFRSSVPSLRTI